MMTLNEKWSRKIGLVTFLVMLDHRMLTRQSHSYQIRKITKKENDLRTCEVKNSLWYYVSKISWVIRNSWNCSYGHFQIVPHSICRRCQKVVQSTYWLPQMELLPRNFHTLAIQNVDGFGWDRGDTDPSCSTKRMVTFIFLAFVSDSVIRIRSAE